ncbi:MAG: hemolysin family protein [Candidatus Borkfalkiaceae bacterium]|nr:hemolysin family protein [Christensenellaceae bacterium]
MPEGSVPLLIAIILLVIASGFFSSTETAYSCANKIKLRSWASAGDKKAAKVLRLAEENYDKLITTILVGNNIVNLTAATLSSIFFIKVLNNASYSSVVSTAFITVSVLIFGEITPKFMAKSSPEKFATAYYPIISFFYYVFYPFNFVFGGWKWLIGKIFRLKSDDVITEEEIMTVVEEAEEDGTLREEETKLIRSVIEFDDVEVGDILVPRVNIVAIDVTTPFDEIKDIFDKEGYSRIPVYRDSIDTIIGTIHEKDFFVSYLKGDTKIDDILQSAFYTTEHVKISFLLKQLQKSKIHIAIVLDEYGGTLGLVTMEDILEELVGEIYDEHDEVINFFKQTGENTYLVDGNAPLSDLFEYFSLDDEENKFDASTVSGWIIETLGEIPPVGRKFDFLNLTVEVVKSNVKKVLQAKITVNPIAEETEE